ncbi:MAG: DUF3850 domain-containing protein [Ruminococcaceae bacterium]|nr:DUF3850 domain-containing protein [Oscillospiraceae bacterium]
MLHKVKLLSGFYQAVIDGIKPFEIRYNDRNYRKGDDIIFNEWKDDAYTGRLCCAVIKDVFDIGFLMPGYVAFTFQILGCFETIEQSDAKSVFIKDLKEAADVSSKILLEETKAFVKENHLYNSKDDFAKAHSKTRYELEAEVLINKGYCKTEEVINKIEEIINKHYNKHVFDSDLEDTEVDAVINYSDDITYDIYKLKEEYKENKECTTT